MALPRLATALLIGAASWWLLAMSAPLWPRALWPGVAPPSLVHALLMNLGVLPLFLAAHVLVAGPAGPRARGLPDRALFRLAALELAGWATLMWGVHHHPAWASAGLIVVAAGRSGMAARAWRLAARHAAPAGGHPWLVAASFTLGALAMWMAAVGMAMQSLELIYAALAVTTWWFVAPLSAAVLHQFAAQVSQWPQRAGLLAAWVGVMALQVPFTLALASGLWPGWGAALTDLVAGCVLLVLAARLPRAEARGGSLAWAVKAGIAWCGIALALQAISIWLTNVTPSSLDLGLAPLHALTMGCFASAAMAVVENAASARQPGDHASVRLAPTLFLAVHVAVAMRLLAEWWWSASSWLLPSAMLIWLAALLLWLWPRLRAGEASTSPRGAQGPSEWPPLSS